MAATGPQAQLTRTGPGGGLTGRRLTGRPLAGPAPAEPLAELPGGELGGRALGGRAGRLGPAAIGGRRWCPLALVPRPHLTPGVRPR